MKYSYIICCFRKAKDCLESGQSALALDLTKFLLADTASCSWSNRRAETGFLSETLGVSVTAVRDTRSVAEAYRWAQKALEYGFCHRPMGVALFKVLNFYEDVIWLTYALFML